MHNPTTNQPEVDIDDSNLGDAALKSYRLQVQQADSAIALTRKRENCWLLKITEPSGAETEICFSAKSELSASIVSN